MSNKKVLILIHKKSDTAPIDPNWEPYRDTVAGLMDAEITMGALNDLVFELARDGMKVYDPARGFSLDEFDLVVFRIIRSQWARVAACCSLLRDKGIPYIDTMYEPRGASKYASEFIRFTAGLPVIQSVFANQQLLLRLLGDESQSPLPYPFIMKDVNGRKGRLNFLIHDRKELEHAFAQNPDVEFIAQEFIPNDGDYRFLIMGDELKLVIHRLAQDGSHLNNTSQGAKSQQITIDSFDPQVVQDALKAAAVESIQVAGVDIIFDKRNGQHHVLEVNSSPQLLTGALPDLKMKAYADYLTSLLG
jgi:glutathione synthase/RimK-type ligase-like ATP-grasp enzyme